MKIIIFSAITFLNFIFSTEKLFIACEGAYYNGQGSLSIIDEAGNMDEIQNLGNVVQSVTVYENNLFVIANGSSIMQVFDIHEVTGDLTLVNTIDLNFSGPRYMLVMPSSNSAYITNWYSQDIKIMDLDTYEITNSIAVNGLPEDIIFDGNNIWVSITLNSDWSDGNTVLKIDPISNTIIETFEVGNGPGDLLFHEGAVYVSRTYYDQYWNAYSGTSRIDGGGNVTLAEYGAGVPCGGNLTKHNNVVYRSYDGGIAPLDSELGILSEQQLGDLGYWNVYDVRSIDGKIYFAITNYADLNQVVILDENGVELSRYDVGLIPTDFAVWNSTLSGDFNNDDLLNINDIVILVNIIVNGLDQDGDMNQDGITNILDIIALVQAILGSRTTDATMIEIFNNNNTVTIEADGYVGAVQMTLSHGNDFSINLTNDAFVAESHTDNNQTTLMVVNPGTELFSANGEFEIVEIIAANGNDYIDVINPDAISLGSAYPNPFNPSTSFDLQVGVAGHVSLNVYNLMGQVVGNLVNNTMDAGNYNITWDAANFSSGMYIVKAETANGIATQKVMLVK